MPSSRGSFRPKGQTGKSLACPASKVDSLPLSHQGGPNISISFVINYFPKQGESWLRGEVFAEETGGVGTDSGPHCLNSWGHSWAWSPVGSLYATLKLARNSAGKHIVGIYCLCNSESRKNKQGHVCHPLLRVIRMSCTRPVHPGLMCGSVVHTHTHTHTP